MTDLLKTIRKRHCASMSLARLASDIEDFEVAFSRYRMDAEDDPLRQTWVEGCDPHLRDAKAALARGDIDSGYQSLLNADRESVALMPSEERYARAISLLHETKEKLGNSWRGKAVAALLAGDPRGISSEAIREALFHRNTDSQNIYRKIELLRKQLEFIGRLLALLLGFGLVLNWLLGVLGPNGTPAVEALFTFAIYMGVLGGTLSAAMSVSKTDPDAKIPDVQRTRLITLARGALGGAAAVPVFLLAQGNVVRLTDATLTPAAVLFFCFLAGFSERWFLSTLETFSKGRASSDKSRKN